MIALTSLHGDDGNALKHAGVQLGNINQLLATIINMPASLKNPNAWGMPSQERPLIYNGPCLCFITAAVANIS